MSSEISLTTIADLPGQNIDPDTVIEQARSMRSIGTNLENGTADVLHTWQRLPASYESTGASAVYEAMAPVGTQGQAVHAALDGAAKALDQYAHEVTPLLTEIATLRQQILDFQSITIPSYPKAAPTASHRTTVATRAHPVGATLHYDTWRTTRPPWRRTTRTRCWRSVTRATCSPCKKRAQMRFAQPPDWRRTAQLRSLLRSSSCRRPTGTGTRPSRSATTKRVARVRRTER